MLLQAAMVLSGSLSGVVCVKMFGVFTQREREFTARSRRATGTRRGERGPPFPPNIKNNNIASVVVILIASESVLSGLQTQQDAHVDFYKDQELGSLAEDILGRARSPEWKKQKCGDQSFSPCKEPDSSPSLSLNNKETSSPPLSLPLVPLF